MGDQSVHSSMEVHVAYERGNLLFTCTTLMGLTARMYCTWNWHCFNRTAAAQISLEESDLHAHINITFCTFIILWKIYSFCFF